ncbi:hypothetical protein [Bradyrhizobium sp. JR3.5]
MVSDLANGAILHVNGEIATPPLTYSNCALNAGGGEGTNRDYLSTREAADKRREAIG